MSARKNATKKSIDPTMPQDVEKAPIGLRDTCEFAHYANMLMQWSHRDIFTVEDKRQLIKPVTDYCKDRDLTEDELRTVQYLRMDAAFVTDMATEVKDALDFAIYRASKEGDEHRRNIAKDALFTINVIDVLASDPDVETFTKTFERSHARGPAREAYAGQHYKDVVEKKFGERYAARLQ